MKKQKIIMGMKVVVEIVDAQVTKYDFDKIFNYFDYVDQKFSTYKEASEISLINQERIKVSDCSQEMKEIFDMSEETKRLTNGYFDIHTPDGTLDPSGLVKGWSIYKAAEILKHSGFKNFYIDVGGDIEARGKNAEGKPWQIGIRNPFNPETEIVKALSLSDMGLATSGTYARGEHIYNPHGSPMPKNEIVSISVIGKNIYEADRFATAAFAMGKEGINFLENLEGFEAYMIDYNGMAIMTSNFEKYLA